MSGGVGDDDCKALCEWDNRPWKCRGKKDHKGPHFCGGLGWESPGHTSADLKKCPYCSGVGSRLAPCKNHLA